MKFVYKLFKQNPEFREGIIAVTSGLGIFVNVVLALIKVFIGYSFHQLLLFPRV